MQRCLLFLGFWVFIFAGTLSAHDLYLHPESFYLNEPGELKLEMRLTEERFPGDPLAWRGNKTVQLKLSGPTGKQDIQNSEGQNPQLSFKKAGTYQIGWESRVSYISINPEIFNQYITLEGYKVAIESRKKNHQENSQGRERYSRFLKTFVQVGNEITDDFKRPIGFKIELIPQTNPSILKIGDEIQLQVLFDGKPLPLNRVMATYDKYSTMAEHYAQTRETNSEGMVRFKITEPGLWMIRTNLMRPVEGDDKADWESFWSTITFQVR